MYRILKDGACLGLTEKVNYIRIQENGCFTLCPERDASGIVFEGKVYNLLEGELPGAEGTVVLEEADSGREILKNIECGSMMFVLLAEGGSLDNVTAGEHLELFSDWAYPVAYKAGQMRKFGGKLYKCLQGHTSQADWQPDKAVSLWTVAADPQEQWPAWSAPLGAHDAYKLGDKVAYHDKHWISETDANVWEPGLYGWREAKDDV